MGTGAKIVYNTDVNGWYIRRENRDARAPEPWIDLSPDYLAIMTGGRPWYEKNDGGFIFWKNDKWCFHDTEGFPCYDVKSEACVPPSQGWAEECGGPATPSLRVVGPTSGPLEDVERVMERLRSRRRRYPRAF